MPQDKGAYVYVVLPWEAHRMLSEMATSLGVRMQDLARDIIIEGLDQGQVPEWYHMFRQDHARRASERLLVSLARDALANMDEERLTSVLEQCSTMGVDPDRVLALASELAQRAQAGNLSSTVQDAVSLLLDLTADDGSVPATVAAEAARREGISQWALYQAKRALGLTSKREGRRWHWLLPTRK